MIITAVIPKQRRRGRIDVHIDGAFAFDVAQASARAHDLRVGRGVTQSEIDAIVEADARRRALETAATLLARRPHAEREIRRRLAMRRFAPDVIEQTMERLRDLRLTDDAEYARTWAESRDRSSPRGRRLIERELRTNVAASIASEAAAMLSDEDGAYRLAMSKRRALAALDYATFRSRLGGLLQRRGFGWDTVTATVRRCWDELHGGAPVDFDEVVQ